MWKKKQVVLSALVLMIGLAGYFNWSYQNSDNGSVSDGEDAALGEVTLVSGSNITEKRDYFAESRMEKEVGRSKALESLKAVAENPESDPEAKKEAQMRIIDMTERMEAEVAAETEIKSKGFMDAIIYINDDSVSVIIKSENDLTGTDAAKIQEIILRHREVDTTKISISRYK